MGGQVSLFLAPGEILAGRRRVGELQRRFPRVPTGFVSYVVVMRLLSDKGVACAGGELRDCSRLCGALLATWDATMEGSLAQEMVQLVRQVRRGEPVVVFS